MISSMMAAVAFRRPATDPANLFADSETGAWYDIQDLDTLWSDTARTTPAVVDGAVRAVSDKSGNGNHLTTASSGVAAILRQDGTQYYLDFDGTDDNFTTTIAFGAVDTLTVIAGFRNRTQTDLAGILEMTSADSVCRIRQAAVGPLTRWDALTNGASGEGTDTAAVYSTTAPNDMVLSSQHDISADLSTIRINGVDGTDGTGNKTSHDLGTMTVNIGKIDFRDAMPMDLYGMIIRGALTPDVSKYEWWMDDAMGGGILSAPSAPLYLPTEGFARDLGGRFPWGVFGQPISTPQVADNVGFWQDVGVNIWGGWNPAVSGLTYDPTDLNDWTPTMEAAAEAWDAAGIAAGFKLDRLPFTEARALVDLDTRRGDMVGWSLQDEPEAGSGFDIGPQLALLASVDPTGSITRAINFTGPGVIYESDDTYPYLLQVGPYPYIQPSYDMYPVQQTTAGKIVILGYRDNGQPYTATHNSLALHASRKSRWEYLGEQELNPMAAAPWSVFIATGGFVETYQTTLRIPTPEQVRFLIGNAIVAGAAGINFFPQRFEWLESPVGSGNYYKTFTQYNATPTDVKAQLTTTIAFWKLMETHFATNLLIDPATNRRWPATYRVCPDTSPSGQQDTADAGLSFVSPPSAEYMPGGFFGATWEVAGVGTIYAITNLMNETLSLTDAVWGLTSVSFAAWETLVFIDGVAAASDIDGLLP